MNNLIRRLGNSDVTVSALGLGCWPLAGMTREGITREDAIATVRTAFESGVTHFDTAYCYGENGESERAIAAAIADNRDAVEIAGKCGIHWEADRKQCVNGQPDRLRREVDESLSRLSTDHLDLLYLHAPDPEVPIEESASALHGICESGKARAIGASNMSVDQLECFHAVCPLSACQMPYNMLQRGIETSVLPWCKKNNVAMVVYWPLMKGLLTGTMSEDRVFPLSDSRHKYPMFQGIEFKKNLRFVDELRPIAARLECAVPDLVLAWTAEQDGITSVLFGATSPHQVFENVRSMTVTLDDQARVDIREAIHNRGTIIGRRAV
ncbi:MAG: aldo/keto reductase [Pirellulales bacterium]